MNVDDTWIAATALAHGVPVVSQDADFDTVADLGGPAVIRV
jgi:predicted nucleic acid-binding protein